MARRMASRGIQVQPTRCCHRWTAPFLQGLLTKPDSSSNWRNFRRARHHLTIAPLLAEAIKRIADESSVSSLFD